VVVLAIPEISRLEEAFPANALEWMPPRDEIPAEFAYMRGTAEACEIASSWFGNGLPEKVKFTPRDGVDAERALRVIQATLGSYAPKHEHKLEAVAYMIDSWFSKVKGWRVKR
jgi:hypothetical protein